MGLESKQTNKEANRKKQVWKLKQAGKDEVTTRTHVEICSKQATKRQSGMNASVHMSVKIRN